jgi:hypothetical protein
MYRWMFDKRICLCKKDSNRRVETNQFSESLFNAVRVVGFSYLLDRGKESNTDLRLYILTIVQSTSNKCQL